MGWHYHGRWGGLGFSDGHYTTPNENINWNGTFDDPVDEKFRDHDRSYYKAEAAYAASAKTALDRTLYWASIIAADNALKDRLLSLVNSHSLNDTLDGVATAAIDAFSAKNLAYNYPAYMNGLDPDDPAGFAALQPGLPGISLDGYRKFDPSAVDPNTLLPKVDPTTNTATTSAINLVRRDPLVLDLDGGGIATSAIDPNAPILFDQDGDGTLTATGWIAASEAIVVRDLNGNGLIDSGRELFGDSTVLTGGPNAGQLAANGFEALADLDADASGVADGKFDVNDAAFNSVRLWQDANQDGVSQAGELHSFAELGVASINVTGTANNINLGGGNTQTFSGSFTRVGDTTGDAGTAGLAGSLLLANNNFYRQCTDDPVLTTEALNLPQMQGSGAVRDLRPAVNVDVAQAFLKAILSRSRGCHRRRTVPLLHRLADVAEPWSTYVC